MPAIGIAEALTLTNRPRSGMTEYGNNTATGMAAVALISSCSVIRAPSMPA